MTLGDSSHRALGISCRSLRRSRNNWGFAVVAIPVASRLAGEVLRWNVGLARPCAGPEEISTCNAMEAMGAMVGKKTLTLSLAWLAVLGMVMPVSLVNAAAPPARPSILASDVALSPGGTLRGQVLSPQGRGLPGVHVAVSTGSRDLGSTVTNAEGRFELRGLKGGVLTLTAAQSQTTVRAWTASAAPPAAKGDVLLVAGQSQALGQWGGFKKVITNPWVIAGIVAAAVAIPVAIHNSNDDDSPASP